MQTGIGDRSVKEAIAVLRVGGDSEQDFKASDWTDAAAGISAVAKFKVGKALFQMAAEVCDETTKAKYLGTIRKIDRKISHAESKLTAADQATAAAQVELELEPWIKLSNPPDEASAITATHHSDTQRESVQPSEQSMDIKSVPDSRSGRDGGSATQEDDLDMKVNEGTPVQWEPAKAVSVRRKEEDAAFRSLGWVGKRPVSEDEIMEQVERLDLHTAKKACEQYGLFAHQTAKGVSVEKMTLLEIQALLIGHLLEQSNLSQKELSPSESISELPHADDDDQHNMPRIPRRKVNDAIATTVQRSISAAMVAAVRRMSLDPNLYTTELIARALVGQSRARSSDPLQFVGHWLTTGAPLRLDNNSGSGPASNSVAYWVGHHQDSQIGLLAAIQEAVAACLRAKPPNQREFIGFYLLQAGERAKSSAAALNDAVAPTTVAM